MITKEELKKIVRYEDGNLFLIKDIGTKLKIGHKLGYTKKTGYVHTKINKKSYTIHRLIYLYHHGYLPKILDHIDCNPANNRIENLRSATPQQNCFNQRLSKNNTSGYRNVQWNKKSNKWRVRLIINGKDKIFGFYDDVELAGLVAEEARNKYHGQFARNF